MDKVTINNQVVFMRKFVKQAKIRAINNYTKEIRKLQNRRGSDDETSKHKRKAERLLAKVVILRKIKPDIVSRKALSKEKDWAAILKEKNIPLEDQCYALLANYAAVQSEVEKFHKKNWDLVPKIPTLFKDWEEKSKDPLNKQQRKEAKKLRKSMKNVKLDKNSSNATPIGSKTDPETVDTPDKNASSENIENTEEAMAVEDEKVENRHSLNDSNPMSLQINTTEKEEISCNKNEEIKEKKFTQRKKLNSSKKSVSKNNLRPVKINRNELRDSIKTPIEQTNDIAPNKNASSNSLVKVESTEEEMETDDKEVKNMSAQNNLKQNSLSIVGIDTTEEEETSKSEDEELFIPRNKSPIKLQVQKTPRDIQSRLKAISNKVDTNANRQFKEKLDASKKAVAKNKLKAVTMLNLNEFQDLDEIPIEKTNEVDEEVEENKRKKDPFFLGKGGEVPSESEDENSSSREQEIDPSAPKRRKFDNFDKKSNEFSKRRSLPSDSRSNFRENGFQRNSCFGDRNNSLNNKERQSSDFKDKGFKNKSFGEKFPSQKFKQNPHTEVRNKEPFQKNNPSSLKKNTTDEKPLHPSWEAKKKLKEASTSKFQGKRIVFDD